MNSTRPLSKIVVGTGLRYGLAAGVLCVLWIIGLYLTYNNPYGPKRLMAVFAPPLAALVSQWFLRKEFEPEGPGIKRAIGVGLLTSFMAAVVSAAGAYGLAQVTGPQQLEKNRQEMVSTVQAARNEYLRYPHGDEQYTRDLQALEHLTPQGIATDDFIKKLLLGLLVSVPGGIFFRK